MHSTEWTHNSTHIIEHVSGFQIVLNQGTWRSPLDIEPRNVKGLLPLEAAKILSEGLIYARNHARPEAFKRRRHLRRNPSQTFA